MGGSSYSLDNRAFRSNNLKYTTATVDTIFTQQKEAQAHPSMKSQGLKKRECFYSDNHPNVIPVIIALDVTGSMGSIPHEFVKSGLPNLMGKLLNNGIDIAVCFIAIGDHTCDSYPLQAGQFESGDEELDMWLTRTYLEGRGGGNNGESYQLAWLFGGRFTETDAYNKRKEKGFLFTIGDEPCLQSISGNALDEILGNKGNETVSSEQLLKEAEEKYNCFHLYIDNGRFDAKRDWNERLGQHCIDVNDYTKVSDIISNILISNINSNNRVNQKVNGLNEENKKEDFIL